MQNITATMDLFDLNRTVYDDVQKLQAVIESVNKSDSTLWIEFKSYWKRNEDILTMADEDIVKDPRFSTYIDSSTVFFDRFQLKLVRINYVLDFATSMLNSYELRYSYVSGDPTLSENQVLKDTKKAIETVKKVYKDHEEKWKELQGTFYKITPVETRKLDAFFQLQEYYDQINNGRQ